MLAKNLVYIHSYKQVINAWLIKPELLRSWAIVYTCMSKVGVICQVHSVERVTLQLGNAKRPGRLVLAVSDDGVAYRPWMIRVSDASDCISLHDVPVMTSPVDPTSVVCVEFVTPAVQNFERVGATII